MLIRLAITVNVLSLMAGALAQTGGQSATQLVKDVAYNELQDRLQQRKYMYRVEKREPTQTLTMVQVETSTAPIYRVIAINGAPVNAEQRQQDDRRIRALLSDSGQQNKLSEQYRHDEQKLEDLMRMMPDAFLYDFDGMDGKLIRLKFRPNPAYKPPDYETRVVHSLAGAILIDPKEKRLVRLTGQIVDQVKFGFGILGHIDTGGTFEVERTQVAPSQWKTSLLHIQMTGRMILFKTVSKQQHEVRSDFREVPGNLTLAQANDLLAAQPVSLAAGSMK